MKGSAIEEGRKRSKKKNLKVISQVKLEDVSPINGKGELHGVMEVEEEEVEEEGGKNEKETKVTHFFFFFLLPFSLLVLPYF